jgi:hypothetical protein
MFYFYLVIGLFCLVMTSYNLFVVIKHQRKYPIVFISHAVPMWTWLIMSLFFFSIIFSQFVDIVVDILKIQGYM